MALPPRARILVRLLLAGLIPLWIAARMDADAYWREDLNGLLAVRTALHLALGVYAGAVCLWTLGPAPPGTRRAEFLETCVPTGLFLGLLATPVPTVLGLVALFEGATGRGWAPEVLGLGQPLGLSLVTLEWMRAADVEPRRRRWRWAGALIPLLLLAGIQGAAWRAERGLFDAVRSGSEAIEATAPRVRPLAWAMNLDPLLTRYLREAGYLVARPVPQTLPPRGELGRRLARAWRLTTGTEIEAAALRRFRVLLASKGFSEPGVASQAHPEGVPAARAR